jgi:hypothetical protein
MSDAPAYTRNQENFAAFYALQGEYVRCLASYPDVIRNWLAAQPRREPRRAGRPSRPQRAWRSARLSIGRRRELSDLIQRVEEDPAAVDSLAALLLGAMPVRTYLEMADAARPSLQAIDARAHELCGQLSRMRERLLMANYGLAQTVARQHHPADRADVLSAAACGLVDAIDRYVPGERAARFSYFASYWIRYHVSRHIQKCGSVVSFPIHQHRIGHRINRYLAIRQASGLPAPSDAELGSALKLGGDAIYRSHQKPQVCSFQSPGARGAALEHYLCDPEPGPAMALEEAEVAVQLTSLLRASAPPAIRVMLAYGRSVGSLADAAVDYLTQLHELAMDRIAPLVRPRPCLDYAGADPGGTGVNDPPACGTACDPAFPA